MPRPKGSLNKKTHLKEWLGTKRDAGLFLLQVLEDDNAPMEQRIDCAKTLLPYMHSKMPVDNNIGISDSITGVIRKIIEHG